MMDCLRHALGEERLLGKQFVHEEPSEPETPIERWHQYLRELNPPTKNDASDDLNPNGFWEDGRFTVKGLRYRASLQQLLKDIIRADKPYFAKIVSQGLGKTDPMYIDQVICMLRHPRAVAKSQERLSHQKFRTADGTLFDIDSKVIHTPKMFINVSLVAAKWLLENPEIPYIIVEYDDLIEQPAETLARVQEFLGEGDFERAAAVVNPKLRRSYPQEVENSLWGEAEKTYELFKQQKLQELLDFFADPKRLIHRETRGWTCVRFGGGVNEAQCRVCKGSEEFRASLRGFANEHSVPWRERPCAFEVAFDFDHPLISIEESIQNNFWEDQHESVRQHQSSRGRTRPESIRGSVRSPYRTRYWRKYCRQ